MIITQVIQQYLIPILTNSARIEKIIVGGRS